MKYLCALLLLASCGRLDSEATDSVASKTPSLEKQQAPTVAEASHGDHVVKKLPVVPRAEQAFGRMMSLIAKHYVDQGIPQDELWTGAMEGVLRRLIQTKKKNVNTLISPARLKEMRVGLKGEISGVGVVIKKIDQTIVVKQALEGGPAAQAGIQRGDRVIAIDGKRTAKLSLGDIVGLIRGKSGTPIDLYMQRETKEWNVKVVRNRVKVPAVRGNMVGDAVGYVHIGHFQKNTVGDLDALLAAQVKQGAKGFVLDLRGCPGGLLDAALGTADRFLEPGKRIVVMRRRGGVEDVREAKHKNPADNMPVVVLIDKHSASGAEIVAAALSDNGRATLIGEPTFGKGTVEKVLELDDGWALKLSIARFFTPKGHSLHGDGVIPDYAVAPGKHPFKFYSQAMPTPDKDPLLRAALHSLKRAER